MAEGKDKFDINNDQKLKEHNLDKSDEPTAKTEIPDGQPEHGNQSHVSEEPTADGVIFPGNDDYDYPVHENQSTESFTDISGKSEMHEGHDHEQYNKLDRDQILDGQPEHGNQSHVSEPTADGVIFPGNDEIHDTEERADADIIPGDVSKVELNQGLGKYVKDGDNLSSDHIAKTEILDGQPEQGILGQANGAPNVSGDVAGDNLRHDDLGMLKVSDDMDGEPGPTDQVSGQVVNMTDMHSHMDDAATHQVPEGPPQDPQGMGLDRLGTQFDEDGMGDMHTPDDPNDGGEVV